VSVMTATFEEMMPYVFGPVDGDSDGNGDDDGENGVGDLRRISSDEALRREKFR